MNYGINVRYTVLLFLIMVTTSCGKIGQKELPKEKLSVKFHKEVIRGKYEIVTTSELKKWVDEKREMVIIDTMPFEKSFKKRHIPGAVSVEFPIPELDKIDTAKRAELIKAAGGDKSKVIVFYCGFTKCTRSHNGAMWAVKLGYNNVYRHPGGIRGWAEAGYPVKSLK